MTKARSRAKGDPASFATAELEAFNEAVVKLRRSLRDYAIEVRRLHVEMRKAQISGLPADVPAVETAMLRERVWQLERALVETLPLPFEWKLTAQETTVFGVMVNRPVATREAFMTALYSHLNRDTPDSKVLDVIVAHIRKKTRPFGVEIRTLFGQGYALDDEWRRKFKVGGLTW